MVTANNRILLIQSPPWGIYAPPLGIAYLATFLRSFNFTAKIYDLNMELFNGAAREIKEKWYAQDFEFWASGKAVDKFKEELRVLADKIISFDAAFIGFSTTRASAPFVNAILAIIRSRLKDKTVIIIGGPGTHYPETRVLFKEDLIDYFIIGEGEYSLLYLLSTLKENKTIQPSSGYAIWKDRPQDRALCLQAATNNFVDVNSIPFPTFEEFDLSVYPETDLLPLISSRGCVRSCVFCCDAPLKKPFRCRSAESVVKEMAYHLRNYGRKRFEFCDLLINGDLNFLDKLCDSLIKMGLDISWGGQAAVRKDMDLELFRKMKKAGCGGLTFGCESFSNHVLRLMHKGITVNDAKETFIKAKESGMLVEINLIVGFPGEEEQDVDETIKFIRENAKRIDKINSLNICTIDCGMYIYDHLEEYGIDKKMFTDWYAWCNKDLSSTLEKRVERHRKLMLVFGELNLKPLWHNVKL